MAPPCPAAKSLDPAWWGRGPQRTESGGLRVGTQARPKKAWASKLPTWLTAQKQALVGGLGQPLDTTDPGRRIGASIKTGSKNCGPLSLSLRPPTSSQPRRSTLPPITQPGTIHLPVICPLRGLPGYDPLAATVGSQTPGMEPGDSLGQRSQPLGGPTCHHPQAPLRSICGCRVQPSGSRAPRIMGDLPLEAGV